MKNSSEKFIKYFLTTVFILGFLLWVSIKIADGTLFSEYIGPILAAIIGLPILFVLLFLWFGALTIAIGILDKIYEAFLKLIRKLKNTEK